jgi:hypothetical protein
LAFYAPHRTGVTARFLQALAAVWLDRKSNARDRSQFKLTRCARGNVTTRALPDAGLGAAGFASLKNSVSEVINSRLIPRGSAWKSGYVEAIEFMLPALTATELDGGGVRRVTDESNDFTTLPRRFNFARRLL